MGIFNEAARGVSREQSRAAFKAARNKTMVEKERIVPVLRPHGMGEEAVMRQQYRQNLKKDHQHSQAVNLRAQQLYQMRVTEVHKRVMQQGKEISNRTERSVSVIDHKRQTTNNFNQHAAQAWDMKELSL